MMFIKKWDTNKYWIQSLLLDLCTIIQIITIILIEQPYKNNIILWFDIIWKSILFQRTTSIHLVKLYKNDYNKNDDKKEDDGDFYGICFKTITFILLFYVAFYWTICVY